MKALVGAFNQEKALVVAFSVIVQPVVEPMDRFAALILSRVVQNVWGVTVQGRRIYKQKGIEIWARPIMPVYRAKYSYAIVFLNRRTDGTPSEVTDTHFTALTELLGPVLM